MIKLNICCGPNIFPFTGWINYDHQDFGGYLEEISKYTNLDGIPDHQKNLVNFIKQNKVDLRLHDIRKQFIQHTSNSVDLIYIGQAIEHINPIYEAPQFINECYRMLKPNGLIRLTTPDLDLLINAYLSGEMNKFTNEQPEFYKHADPSAQLSYLMYGASGPNCTWNNYEGHMHLYTQKSMTALLSKVGFKEINFYYESGKSKNDIMAKECVDAGLSHSFIVEAIK